MKPYPRHKNMDWIDLMIDGFWLLIKKIFRIK